MERIKKISLGKESSDGMKYKVVETTLGTFKTRCCAYNQTIERLDDKHRSDTKKNFSEPPIKIVTLKYDTEFRPRQKFLFVKQLTESYETRKEFYGCDIFVNEVEYLKTHILESFDKVVLVNYRIPFGKGKSKMFDQKDIFAMVGALIMTETPHVTIPFLDWWSAEECLEVLEKLKKEMFEHQDYFASINPHMDILEQKRLIESLKKDDKFRGLMMSCYSPFDPNNASAYNQASRLMGNEKLFMIVDVNDNPKIDPVSLHLLLGIFNADITCRNVRLDMDRNGFDTESKKDRNKIKWYIPSLGGLLNPLEQKNLTGFSLDSLLAPYYLPKLTNLNHRELSILFNFLVINREGEIEREAIDLDMHTQFIKNKPLLSRAIDHILSKSSGNKVK